MTITEINTYFQEFSELDPGLQHSPATPAFFKGDSNEGVQHLHSGLNRMTLMVAPYPKRPNMSSGENHAWRKSISILIVDQASQDDYERQEVVRENAEAICDRLFSKMMRDRIGELYGFDGSTFLAEPIGPIIDCHYGYALSFEIMDPVNLAL